jgi:CRISPR system Cascade subunit CasB
MSETPRTIDPRPAAAQEWWADLQDQRNGNLNPRADRAARARLRRGDPDRALTEEAVLALYRRLAPEGAHGFSESRMKLAVRLALVLVHIREDVNRDDQGNRKSFARQLGRAAFDEPKSARLSPLRFQRLLNARQEDEIVQEFRRAVDLAGNKANVEDLAGLLLHWEGEKTRARFAFDYFAAGSAAQKADAASALPA